MQTIEELIAGTNANYEQVLREFIEQTGSQVMEAELREDGIVEKRQAFLETIVGSTKDFIEANKFGRGEICWGLACANAMIMEYLNEGNATPQQMSKRALFIAATLLLVTTVDLDVFKNMRDE